MCVKFPIKFSLNGEIRRVFVQMDEDTEAGFFEKLKSQLRELFSPRLRDVCFNLELSDED